MFRFLPPLVRGKNMAYKLPIWAKDFSDQKINDDGLNKLISLPEMKDIRWLDLRFNRITLKGLEFLCKADLPDLEVAELYGNLCGNLSEICTIDVATGLIVPSSVKSKPLVISLEEKYGYKKWLHPLSEFGDPFPSPNVLNPLFADEDFEDSRVIWDV